MIARFHYDRCQLQSFLEEDPSVEPGEIQTHIESCDHCQTELETLAKSDFDWDQAAELLRVESYPPTDSHDHGAPEDNWAPVLQPTDHPGSLGRFARYEILEILGRGGMGVVMRGYDTSLNRHSAIKVLAPELASSEAARKRFSREAKSAAAVVHPHVVPIQTVDEHDGLSYLVMPVVEGKSVDTRVRNSGPLSVIETVRIASQVAEGLAAAHEQGLVHRDIKPANVLLENGVERVQITDFGLARAVDDASMTRSGMIAGTPQYMSPEQAHGDAIDHRSDLFSLGSLIYFMLTGRSPFRAETTMGVLNRIVHDEPRSIRGINAEVPEWLDQFVAKLLCKSPDGRFQTADEVASLLQRWHAHLQQPSTGAEPTWNQLPAVCKPPIASRNFTPPWRWLVATAACGFFLVAGAIILLETDTGTLRIESNADSDVPVVIRQDGKIVQELTVSQEGNTARLRAGTYSIEAKANDATIKVHGDQVTIEAGGQWIARIEIHRKPMPAPVRRDPSDVRVAAVKDIERGKHEDALEKIMWCWNNGVQFEPAWTGVRRSFLLSDWLELADVYPPALAKLKSVRDELLKGILSENQLRVRSDDFADLSALYRTLREDERSIEVYESLNPHDQKRLFFYLPYCPSVKKPAASNCKQCHHAYPAIATDAGPSKPESPKRSPFTRVEFEDGKVIVRVDEKQYEWLGIDHFSIDELVAHTRHLYGEKWKKRLSEDLVEVLWTMGQSPGQTVDLHLRSLETGAAVFIKDADLSQENRSRLYQDNEHNQPD